MLFLGIVITGFRILRIVSADLIPDGEMVSLLVLVQSF